MIYYLLADWESFIYNNKVLENVLFNKDFRILDSKYYLADIKYHNIDYLFCFYCSFKYYFKEKAVAEKKLMNKKELFNFYHLSFYNMVERIFGMTKRYF